MAWRYVSAAAGVLAARAPENAQGGPRRGEGRLFIRWVSGALPGSVHDEKAEWTWRILRKLRCCPWRAGQLAKAIHALEIHAA